LEHVVERQGRVEDERDRGIAVEPLTQRVQQGRLAGAHLAGEHDEALSLLRAVVELGERLAMAWAHVEEPRVGRRVERLFEKPVELQVHGGGPQDPVRVRSEITTSWCALT